MPGTMLEYLAGKALEQHRVDLDEQRRSPEYLTAAARMALDSVGRWFPPVMWEVLDHTLHLAPIEHPAVIVRPVDDEEPEVDVRLLVQQRQDNGPLGSVYVIYAITPGTDPVSAASPPMPETHHLIRSPVHLGEWVEAMRAQIKASAAPIGGSVNAEVYESTVDVRPDVVREA